MLRILNKGSKIEENSDRKRKTERCFLIAGCGNIELLKLPYLCVKQNNNTR